MNGFARRVANAVGRANPQHSPESLESVAYGLQVIFNDATKLVILFLLYGFLFSPIEYLLLLVCWTLPHLFMGGFHNRTWLGCLVSALVCQGSILLLSRYVGVLVVIRVAVLLAGLGLVFLLAPADHRNKPIRSPQKRKQFKWLSCNTYSGVSAASFLLPGTWGHIAFWTPVFLVLLMVAGKWTRQKQARTIPEVE